jgi:hypothetical protein
MDQCGMIPKLHWLRDRSFKRYHVWRTNFGAHIYRVSAPRAPAVICGSREQGSAGADRLIAFAVEMTNRDATCPNRVH